MIRFTSALLIFAGVSISAQNSDAPKKFIGEWQAKLRNKVICTIRLDRGEPISGQSENCAINIDANGNLQEPESDDRAETHSPILNPKLQGSTLRFEIKDGGDVLKFEFTLVGDSKAELNVLDAPVHMKPVPFTRQ